MQKYFWRPWETLANNVRTIHIAVTVMSVGIHPHNHYISSIVLVYTVRNAPSFKADTQQL